VFAAIYAIMSMGKETHGEATSKKAKKNHGRVFLKIAICTVCAAFLAEFTGQLASYNEFVENNKEAETLLKNIDRINNQIKYFAIDVGYSLPTNGIKNCNLNTYVNITNSNAEAYKIISTLEDVKMVAQIAKGTNFEESDFFAESSNKRTVKPNTAEYGPITYYDKNGEEQSANELYIRCRFDLKCIEQYSLLSFNDIGGSNWMQFGLCSTNQLLWKIHPVFVNFICDKGTNAFQCFGSMIKPRIIDTVESKDIPVRGEREKVFKVAGIHFSTKKKKEFYTINQHITTTNHILEPIYIYTNATIAIWKMPMSLEEEPTNSSGFAQIWNWLQTH
jgi:hypothetical protein